MLREDGPIYQGTFLYKNGKRYDLEAEEYIFDCPEFVKGYRCAYVTTAIDLAGAETALDIHYATSHPEAHVPLISVEDKAKLGSWFRTCRQRVNSPVATIRPASK